MYSSDAGCRESEAEMSRKAESNLVKASVPDYSAAPHIIIIREEMSVISNDPEALCHVMK